MALQFVSSVPHEEMHNELWLKRMEESGIDGFEYSCGPFPPTAELQSKLDSCSLTFWREQKGNDPDIFL